MLNLHATVKRCRPGMGTRRKSSRPRRDRDAHLRRPKRDRDVGFTSRDETEMRR